eukprot:1819151-Rhodomonas_salina.3
MHCVPPPQPPDASHPMLFMHPQDFPTRSHRPTRPHPPQPHVAERGAGRGGEASREHPPASLCSPCLFREVSRAHHALPDFLSTLFRRHPVTDDDTWRLEYQQYKSEKNRYN